jgi:hypothetical protein
MARRPCRHLKPNSVVKALRRRPSTGIPEGMMIGVSSKPRWWIARIGAIAFAVVVGSCSSPIDPIAEERRVGMILGFNNDDPRIVVPDTVEAGADFVVEVTTYGDSCFRKGEIEMASMGDRVTITPYDYIDLGAAGCQRILLSFIHEIEIQFSDVGTASVVIIGQAGGAMEEELIEVTHEVVVVSGGGSL